MFIPLSNLTKIAQWVQKSSYTAGQMSAQTTQSHQDYFLRKTQQKIVLTDLVLFWHFHNLFLGLILQM